MKNPLADIKIAKLLMNEKRYRSPDDEEIYDFEPQKMVSWFHLPQLAATGFRAVVSALFGSFADKRDMMSVMAQHKQEVYAYVDREEIWIDFIADLGDGFDSTYTMAYLLAKEKLQVAAMELPRADILILGGDQVYPTASREAYRNRFKAPYNLAFPANEKITKPHLFAIAGNHDWYDGLNNFMRIFCRERLIGNWQTQQARSYFSLQLPYNWWIWAIDIQLEGDIDQIQLDYFEAIKAKMSANDKVILCTAEPSWVYYADGQNAGYRSLRYFEDRFFNDRDKPLQYVLSLSGDLHHYSRYACEDASITMQKIVSGGGGAFLHPTHNLPSRLKQLREGNFQLKTTFPSQQESSNLSWRNFLFTWYNKTFSLYIGVFFLLITWIIESKKYGANDTSATTFMNHIKEVPFTNLIGFLIAIKDLYINNLILLFFNIALVGIMYFYADIPTNQKYKPIVYRVFGGLHSLVQIIIFYFLLWIISHALISQNPVYEKIWQQFLIYFLGGITVSTIFGIHLFISNHLLGNHDNESFSSLKWEGFKNFLKIHVTKDGVTIYPIGVREISRWTLNEKKTKATPDKEPAVHLIENKIEIKP